MHQEARYDAVADFYAQFAPDVYDDPLMAALLRLIGDVRDQALLDLVCGHGRLARCWPAHGLRPKVGANHRMLATYLNTLARHGLNLEEIAEPMPEAAWLAQAPSSGPVPVYLVARCRNRGG